MILGDMFELGSESKRASANCRLPIEGENNVFFLLVMFYSSRVSNPQFQFYESFDSF
jgi:hypothetical protein